MSFLSRIYPRWWIVVLIAALGVVGWLDLHRIRHIDTLTAIGSEAPQIDVHSLTGYTGGVRQLLVPEHNNESYQWIVQTQQMLARHEWRIRHVDYDNAPFGRDVRTPSIYRWWLGLVAWGNHLFTQQPIGLAAERAALYAGSILHALFIVGSTCFVARRFGGLAATLVALGLAALFPLATAFQPGQPDDSGLSIVCAFFSVVPLLAAFRESANVALTKSHRSLDFANRGLFILAGIASGIGFWTNPVRQLAILLGIAAGGAIAAWASRSGIVRKSAELPARMAWRVWGIASGTTVLVGYLLEFAPAFSSEFFHLTTLHPMHGLACVVIGELLERLDAQIRNARAKLIGASLFGTIAVLVGIAVPFATWFTTPDRELLIASIGTTRLTNLPDGVIANNLADWLWREGFTPTIFATLFPLVALLIAAWLVIRSTTTTRDRAAILFALCPVGTALLLAGFRLQMWNTADALLLALVSILAAAVTPIKRIGVTVSLWIGGAAIAVIAGLRLIVPMANPTAAGVVTEFEAQALVERDLAQWLARRTGANGAIVLAPPGLTTSCIFHGGLRGVFTPYLGNKDGFAAAVRIAAASSPDEAQALVRRRGVTHIIVPSWDPALDELARLGANQPENSLMGWLHRWLPPRWLRPVAYQFPKLAGFENQTAAVFEVVEVQDNATALSRLAEYFTEMGQHDQAAAASEALSSMFPDDFGALLAQAEVATTLGQSEKFAVLVKAVEAGLADGSDETLPWDRRVNLAIILAEAKRTKPAREQIRRCLAEIDEAQVRSLTMAELYRFQVLIKGLGEQITDPKLRALAQNLLPPEMRGGFQ